MAPQHGMLSHLRFHRPSPTSPAADPSSPSSLHAQQTPVVSEGASPLDGQASLAGSSSLPPILPPIARVTSTEIDLDLGQRRNAKEAQPDNRSSQSQVARSAYKQESKFLGGLALRNYRRDAEAQQAAGAEATKDQPRSRPKSISVNTDLPARSLPNTLSNNKSTPVLNAPNGPQSASTASQTRSPLSRINHEALPSATGITTAEPQKGRKGLPFLKNPMSTLLLRRKANQNIQNKLSSPLESRTDELIYDPRIKGTRVHDFSAPRRKSNVPTIITPATPSTPQVKLTVETRTRASHEGNTFETIQGSQRRQPSNASDPRYPISASTISQAHEQSSSISSVASAGTQFSLAEQTASIKEDQLAPPPPPKESDKSLQATPCRISGMKNQDGDAVLRTLASSRTARSRSVSLSSIPRHMKSTSSRFSFDMIGAAKQEKIMEDRHRQRELDRQTAAANAPRSSAYDEYDEDAFDYDAMMDDDGLEERIPGVNADYDDDQLVNDDCGESAADNDPGILDSSAFQMSNLVSSQETQAAGSMEGTGGDVEGSPNGPGGLDPGELSNGSECPILYDDTAIPEAQAPSPPTKSDRVSGLGIQSIDHSVSPRDAGPATRTRGPGDDDLYFDGGIGFGDEFFAEDLAMEPEGDGVPFDESIFDMDDTDQYGRPVPGAFALAQSLRRANNQQQPASQKPYVASRLSGRRWSFDARSSGAREEETSGTHDGDESHDHDGSHGASAPPKGQGADAVAAIPTTPGDDYVAAYQAALAAAAQEAAASGKFERSFSPTAGRGDGAGGHGLEVGYSDGYDDGGYDNNNGMDDYELDDDAIIAEANASALANDADGWYGQEFGFYSAPVSHHGAQSADSETYGGFFGPKGLGGLGRTTSGRVVSKEPNLTPITERSEYSNRNSFMSLGLPGMNGSGGTPTMQSPGLAQLAMMADRGEDITLSALLRLRSKAWGDSQASLVSSNGSPRCDWGEGPCSPRAGSFAGHLPASGTQGRKNSVLSVDAGSVPGSPTLTVAIPVASLGDAGVPADAIAHAGSTLVSSPGTMTNEHDGIPGKGHQRSKGSADSISYRKEEESGETRWVMERRRTGEFGQVEIVEREVVEGGRI